MNWFKRRSVFTLVLMGLLPLACTRRQVFKPAGYKWPVKAGEIASWKEGILPDQKLDSNFEVFTEGIVRRNVGGRKIPTILVHISVTNKTDQQLTLDGAQSHLTDNRGRLFKPCAVVKNGAQQFFARLKPQSHALIDIFYDVPRGVNYKDISSFTVHWRYTVGGVPYCHDALFQRSYAVE